METVTLLRYAKANNKYVEIFDKAKDDKTIFGKLPADGFQGDETFKFTTICIKSYKATDFVYI